LFTILYIFFNLDFGIAGGGVELQVVDFARLRITPARKKKKGKHSDQ